MPAVTSTDMAAPTGKFVRFHAVTKPSTLNGAGSENALPSTAWAVVLNAIVTVTYSGSRTVTAQRMRMMVPVQLTRSILKRPLGRLRSDAFENLRGLDRFDDESWLNRHQRAFLPRVIESWRTAMRTVMTKKTVAFAIW